MQDEHTVAQRLLAEGIADYPEDLRQLSAAELRQLFAFASSGKINATRVIKNLIWQAYTALRAAFLAAATPYLRALRPLDGLCALLEEAARRRLDALPFEAVVAQIAQMEAGDLLALARHLRPRLVPSEEPPAAAVAEGIVQMDAAALRELVRRLQERRAAEA